MIVAGWIRVLFPLAGLLALVVFCFAGTASATFAILAFNLLALAALGVRAHRDPPGHPSRSAFAGFVLYTAAQLLFILRPALTGQALPFPSVVDAGFFAAYCLYFVALVRVLRRSSSADRGWLDVAIVVVSLTAPLWQFVMNPSLGAPLTTSGRAATLMYPLMLMGLFALGLRLVLLPGYRGTPDLLLLGWVSGEFAANIYLATSVAGGSYDPFSPWFGFLFFSWGCIGSLALSPGTPSTPRTSVARAPGRLVLLSVALLVPVGTLAARGDSRATYALCAAGLVTIAAMARLALVTGDLSEQRRLASELALASSDLDFRVHHDSLTGLPNRVLLSDRLDVALAQRATHRDRGVVLLLLDLDGFKAVNDTHGHETGDQVLIAVGELLRRLCREGDTVARLGGDEFAIVLPAADLTEALRLTNRIGAELLQPLAVDRLQLIVGASIGVVLADGQDRSRLLREADIAMYAAKRAGGCTHAVFRPALHADVLDRYQLDLELRGAADRGELVLEYQPVLHLGRHRMVAVEALLRWEHPTRGRIPPLRFIPLAEESGSIRQIGDWVLETACLQLAAWDREHPGSALGMAVNLSPRQLHDVDLVERVALVLTRVGVAPGRITLEVTETALSDGTEAMIERLHQLKALGLRLAIDDFGTGSSSLSFLRRLPVDVLKVDKSFVDGIAREPAEWALTTAIIKLATSLGKQTLAEGIESGGQLAHLRALHCELGQGYLFDRPLPPGAISERLATMTHSSRG